MEEKEECRLYTCTDQKPGGECEVVAELLRNSKPFFLKSIVQRPTSPIAVKTGVQTHCGFGRDFDAGKTDLNAISSECLMFGKIDALSED